MVRHFLTISSTIALSSAALFTIALLSSTASADNTDVVDQINITVPVSCTMSGTGMTSHTAEIQNGETNSSIGETTIKVFCNDATGYAVYAIGYTDNEDGKNVLTSSALGGTYDIATGTATSGNSSNWAMKLSTITSPTPTYPITIQNGFDSFHTVPDDYTLVAKSTTGTDIGINAEGSTLKTTYQAYVSTTQPAGTYTGQVKYTLVHPHDASAPEKPSLSCTTLVPNYTYMQDINSTNITSVLNSLEEDEPYYLRDKRDYQPYCVAKLKDGKLWMTENLNIAGGTILSSTDTDFDSNYTLPTTDGWTAINGKLILPASATKNTADNNLTDTTQFSTDNYAYVFNSGNKVNCGASGQSAPCYSYYSWDAATLGSGRSISGSNIDAEYSICPKGWGIATSRTTAAANWQTNSDLYVLAHQYGLDSDASTLEKDSDFYNQAGPATVPNFLLGGGYDSGVFRNSGSTGLYWSSTSITSSAKANVLGFNASRVDTANSFSRRSGMALRCLFKN